MDASFDCKKPVRQPAPRRFTCVSIQSRAGDIEARLSEQGNWEIRLRRHGELTWRLACRGDLDCGGTLQAEPVAVDHQDLIVLGPLTVDPEARRATVNGSEVRLCRKEFALLLALASQPDRVFTKEELLATVWGHSGPPRTRTLESHASRLRRKLRAAGAAGLVVVSTGIGYRLRDRPDLARVPALAPAGEAP